MTPVPPAAAARLREAAGGTLDAAIVLGSGLSTAAESQVDFATAVSYAELEGAPRSKLAGHPGIAACGIWSGKRVAAFAGRAHLYQGHTPAEVTYFVRLAAAAGARAVVLTNAAGGVNEAYRRGDVMVIADHINLTGASAIAPDDPEPFLDMVGAYSARLRRAVLERTTGARVREGVYAGLRGPAYETLAEARALRALGADAVGMSTVLETMAARRLGLEVFGLSLITNTIGPSHDLSHAGVLEASLEAADGIAALVGLALELL